MPLAYTGIIVKDLEQSIRFYCESFSMKLKARIKNEYTNGEFAVLENEGADGLTLELNWYADKKEYTNGDELDHLGFEVENARVELDRFRKLGIEIAQEPYETENVVVFFAKDPNGIWLEIYSRKRS
jgi:lactoylglutathione lyase